MHRILLTTDGSGHSLKGARYLASLYRGAENLEVNVLTVSPRIPPLFLEEASHDPKVMRQFESWKRRKEEEAQKCLEEAKVTLQQGGLKKNPIQTKYKQLRVGVAQDIIREADAEKYNGIVIGKKGMGWLDEMLLGSITNKLLEISEDHPLWVVDGKDWNPRKILIAMDETEHAVEVAGYAGRMLQGLPGVEILLYHFCLPYIDPPVNHEEEEIAKRYIERRRDRMTHFFAEAQKVLRTFGFQQNAVQTRFYCQTPPGDKKISQAILAEVREGNFGTLVIGRKGSTRAREFKLGSVSLRTVTEAENCAVWVV
jgi:nucleotide-binding universal stress UspA family protein